jgi:hypothetical protein
MPIRRWGSAPELAPSSVELDSAAQAGLTLAERVSNTESGLPRDGAPVSLALDLSLGAGRSRLKSLKSKKKKVAERVGLLGYASPLRGRPGGRYPRFVAVAVA